MPVAPGGGVSVGVGVMVGVRVVVGVVEGAGVAVLVARGIGAVGSTHAARIKTKASSTARFLIQYPSIAERAEPPPQRIRGPTYRDSTLRPNVFTKYCGIIKSKS
jgi:hypothetical protein